MTVKMFCDGPECEVTALVGDPDWWLVQQLRETFHFHEIRCLAAWASFASSRIVGRRICWAWQALRASSIPEKR